MFSLLVECVVVSLEYLEEIDVVMLVIVGIVDVVVVHAWVLHITDQWDVVDLCFLGTCANNVCVGKVSSRCVTETATEEQ